MSPPKRRTYGSGSITQRADGLWIGRVYTGRWTATGERERLTRSGKSRAIVEGKLRALTREIADKGAPRPGLARGTVKTWAEIWLPRHAETARPNYYTTDAGHVHKWIVPTLGHLRLSELAPRDVRALRAAVTKPDPPRYPNGRSTTTAHAAQGVLVRMLTAAREDGHVIDASILTMKKPTKAVNDRTTMTVPELVKVLEVISHRADRSRWLAAILTGGRQAETLGLTWDRVNLTTRRLEVAWQIQPLPYKVKGDRSSGFRVPDGFDSVQLIGALHLTRPKTSKSWRVIPIVKWLAAALAEAQDAWVPNPWNLIWTETLRNGEQRPIRDGDDRARWHEIQAEAGVAHPSGRPYHVHETRHSVVSMLLADGVDRSVIETIVGQTTLVEAYIHVNTDAADAALEKSVAGRLQLGQA